MTIQSRVIWCKLRIFEEKRRDRVRRIAAERKLRLRGDKRGKGKSGVDKGLLIGKLNSNQQNRLALRGACILSRQSGGVRRLGGCKSAPELEMGLERERNEQGNAGQTLAFEMKRVGGGKKTGVGGGGT